MIIGMVSIGSLILYKLNPLDRSGWIPPSCRQLTGDPIKDDYLWSDGGFTISKEDAAQALQKKRINKFWVREGYTKVERQQIFEIIAKFLHGETGRILP